MACKKIDFVLKFSDAMLCGESSTVYVQNNTVEAGSVETVLIAMPPSALASISIGHVTNKINLRQCILVPGAHLHHANSLAKTIGQT